MRIAIAAAVVGVFALNGAAHAQYYSAPYGYANPYMQPPGYDFRRDEYFRRQRIEREEEEARREHWERERFEHRRFEHDHDERREFYR